MSGHGQLPDSVKPFSELDVTVGDLEWLKALCTVLTWASVAVNVPIVIVCFTDPRRRRIPASVTSFLSLTALVFNVVLGMGSLVGYRQLPDVKHQRPSEYPFLCKVQGVLVHYVGNGARAVRALALRLAFALV